MMKLVAEYDISPESVNLEYWNSPDILDSMGREGEPFEDAEDLLTTIAEALDNNEIDIDDVWDQFSMVQTWTVRE